MLVDVLVVGGDVSPLFVEQEEEIEPPGGILHVELGELLADAEHRHGEELAREAMVEQAARHAHALLGEVGPDGLVDGPPAQQIGDPAREVLVAHADAPAVTGPGEARPLRQHRVPVT